MSQIITIDDLTAYSNETIDANRGGMVVDAVNQYVETRTSRSFGETKQIENERYDWGKNPIWLRHMDVVSVDDVTLGWPGQTTSTLPSNSYYLNSLGRVSFFATATAPGQTFNDYLAISYTYGTMKVPDDLKLAALAMAAGFYDWAINNGRSISAVSVGTYSLTYSNKRMSGLDNGTPASSPDDPRNVIDSYRMRRQ